MPNAVIGVVVVGLAVVFRWYLRRTRNQPADEHAQGQESKTHPGSVTRGESAMEPCGTIDPVTPMPAPMTSQGSPGVPQGFPAEPGGAVVRSEPDPTLAAAVDVARAAAEEETTPPGDDPIGSPVLTLDAEGGDAVGAHVGVRSEGPNAATHYFESNYPGYVGWRWAVTVASAGSGEPVTVSEVVLLPGPNALTAPQWVPWSERVQPGDLGAGDLLPSGQDDPRLVPGYLADDEPEVRALAREVGFGRSRVLSPEGRAEAAQRWHEGEFGPDSEIARMAPGACRTCGFFIGMAGPLQAAFGVCGNALSPADGHVVHVDFGCGAHSETDVDVSSTVPVAEVVYDDATLDYEPRSAERE